MLSKHSSTISYYFLDLPRSLPVVCFLLASMLAVSPDSFVPRVPSKHLGLSTIAPWVAPRACRNRFPVLPRSSPLVFLLLASSLAVSPGFPGVPGCLASTWGLSTIAPRASRDLRRLFFYDLLSWGPGCLGSTPGLYTIAPWACRDLRQWFSHDSLPRSRSLLVFLGSPGA